MTNTFINLLTFALHWPMALFRPISQISNKVLSLIQRKNLSHKLSCQVGSGTFDRQNFDRQEF
jgi:hypothetical protein